mgnify:CR=1 FL=1
MALPHPDVNAVLRFPAKLGTSHKKAPQNLFKTPFAPSNFPPRRHTAAPHVFLRRAGRLCPPKHRTPCPSVGGDAHAVERSGTSTLGVHRPVCRGSSRNGIDDHRRGRCPHRPLCRGSAAASSLPGVKGGIVCTSPLRCHSEPVLTLARESASPVPCLSLWERWPSAARTERANKEGPPPGGPSFSVSKNLSCHSEEHPKGTCFAARSDVGIRSPRPQARNSPLPL